MVDAGELSDQVNHRSAVAVGVQQKAGLDIKQPRLLIR